MMLRKSKDQNIDRSRLIRVHKFQLSRMVGAMLAIKMFLQADYTKQNTIFENEPG